MNTPSPISATAHPLSKKHSLSGRAQVPGDKSISHRALMLSSQVIGRTTISGLLEAEDVMHSAKALQALGVPIEKRLDGHWQVDGVGVGGLQESTGMLDMGNAGTGVRLLAGLVAPYPFTSFFTGDASLCSRPMQRIITPLEKMGVRVISRSGGRLPLAVIGSSMLLPITYSSPVASAQIKSAIMLAALNIPGQTTVIEPQPSRDHSERMLSAFGAEVDSAKRKDGTWRVTITGQPDLYTDNRQLHVPADPSSAAFLMVAALIIPGSSVTIPNVCINPLRIGLFDTLREMGASIDTLDPRTVSGEEVADIKVEYSELKGITIPAERAPSMIDEYPILAIAAAFAEGTTTMQGLAELRVKESDRLAAIEDGLKLAGVSVESRGDTLQVTGMTKRPAGGCSIASHGDHRIAMSFLILGLASKAPISIDDIRCIDTSFPGFISLMRAIGAEITVIEPATEQRVQATTAAPTRSLIPAIPPIIIAIDGPAASGKGSLARRLADYFGVAYLDTGKLYRAVGLKLVYADKDPQDMEAAVEAAHHITPDDLRNPRLLQEHIGKAASIVSAMPEVRQALLEYQQEFSRRSEGAILDGRDIGTVVCPEADLKLFITADMDARARRRHKELQGLGVEVVYDSVLNALEERDKRDRERSAAPLRPADDAICIDTTKMDADTVFSKVVGIIEERFSKQRERSDTAA